MTDFGRYVEEGNMEWGAVCFILILSRPYMSDDHVTFALNLIDSLPLLPLLIPTQFYAH